MASCLPRKFLFQELLPRTSLGRFISPLFPPSLSTCPTRHTTDSQILGTLVFEVYYVLRNYGGELGEWRQSFHDLTTGGSGLRSEKPAPAAGVVTQSAV